LTATAPRQFTMRQFGLPSLREATLTPLISAKPSTVYPPLSAFPKQLPAIFVPGDAVRRYGLAKASLTLRRGIKDFVSWSTASIQLDRSDRYSSAVQRTTTDKHETCILAYLGFLVNIKGDVSLADASIEAYSDPVMFAGFLAFLRARDVGRGHVLKHVSLARKVNNYLISGQFH